MLCIGAITIGIDQGLDGEAVSNVMDTRPARSGAWRQTYLANKSLEGPLNIAV